MIFPRNVSSSSSRIKWTVIGCICSIACASCVSTRVVTLSPPTATSAANIKIIDRRIPTADRSLLTERGNIFSCFYGIDRVKESETVPERLSYLQASLDASPLGIRSLEVTITRFDIYLNNQRELKENAAAYGTTTPAPGGSFAAGALQGALAETAAQTGTVIGCDGTDTGEYRSTEYKDHGRPAIAYLDGEVNGKKFHIRQIFFATDKGVFEPGTRRHEVAQVIDAVVHDLVVSIGEPRQ
jgi:hypothetical protein